MKFHRIASALMALMMAAGSFAVSSSAATDAVSANAAAEEEAAIDCRYIGFDTTVNMYKYSAAIQAGSGNYKIITEGEDAPYLKLLYSNEASSYSPYRFNLKFTSAGKVNTEFKFMRITYRSSDKMAASINVVNTASEGKITLVENTAASKGEWVRSEAVNITTHSILSRFASGTAIPFEYTGSWKDANIDIKEVVFFKTVEDAYAYYGESAPSTTSMISLTFGELGNGKLYTGVNYGEYTVNDADGTIDIVYAEKTNYSTKAESVHYMAKVKGKATYLADNSKYMRLEYALENPDGVESINIDIASDGDRGASMMNLVTDAKGTNGKFVLSPTVEMNDLIVQRFLKNGHCSVTTNCTVDGGLLRIKALHFFTSKEDADAYSNEPPVPDKKITLLGNDISKYTVVVAEDAPAITVTAAKTLAKRIEELTGTVLPVVTDTEKKGEYEIIVGQTNRKSSYEKLYEMADGYKDHKTFAAYADGESLIITAVNGYAINSAVDIFMRSYLYVGIEKVPKNIDIDSVENFLGKASGYSEYSIFEHFENIENPTVFTEDFDTDDGYFTEESGEDGWKYENGSYVSVSDGAAHSYVHVWEPDVSAEATFKFAAASDNGDFGLMLRYTDSGAYAKAGYDFLRGEWYIDYREGLDHYRVRAVSAADTLKAGTEYKLGFTADDEKASLTVNGKEVVSADIHHVTPGHPGVYSKNISVTVDDYSAVLLSGEGTVFKNVTHIKLPDDIYREGGTVIEMNDGRWIYQHHSGVAFVSTDKGLTWQKTEVYFPLFGYQQILRLNDGDLMQIGTAYINGEKHIVSFTSADDGKTWVQGGSVIASKHPVFGIAGGNMNDKITQMSDGRIFYSVGYEGSATINGKKISVFCEYHYSDDKGKTWHQSKTASYDIEGLEGMAKFGENKILECADGTLRMYCSWNTLGSVVYSESTDNGVTWGPIQYLEGFTSSHASMQFARDPYGPTPTTYYMVWIYAETPAGEPAPNRSRLSLAYTEDGKSWEYLGDIWRWETAYRSQLEAPGINHIVDPFIRVTEDYVICGTGISEKFGNSSHYEQRQNIWSIEKATLPEGVSIGKFTDVKLGAPYYGAVMYAVENGLFNGTSETTFEPDTTMNRAMFVTVLGRLDKADVSKYTVPSFDDVQAGQWYTSYVEWAAANGIVNGIGGGKYGVTGTITVEQACTILYRYNGGKAGSLDGKSMSDFSDASAVSSWAADGVKWAVENGIYEGANGKLDPTSAGSRALVATMFANYVKAFG